MARLIDSYAEGLIDKQEFEPRVPRMRARVQHLEAQVAHLKAAGERAEELRLVVGRLETLAARVYKGLQQADFQTRREIIRSLVKRVAVDQQHIRIVFRVSPTSVPPSSDSAPHHWQDSGRRVHTRALQGHYRALVRLQPPAKGHKLTVGGTLLDQLGGELTVLADPAKTGCQLRRMSINATPDWMDHLHRTSFLQTG
jgi:site-specific DNA recombinase